MGRKVGPPGVAATSGTLGTASSERIASDREYWGGVVGALGLFFAGMWFLTENLKTLANRRLRMMAARWTENPRMAFAWGALLGGITQNMPAVVFIVVGMMQSGILSVRRALPVILGASFGTSLLVFVVTFDIELVSLYVLGIASAIMVSARASRFRPLAASLFGMGMLIFGLVLLKDLGGSHWTSGHWTGIPGSTLSSSGRK